MDMAPMKFNADIEDKEYTILPNFYRKIKVTKKKKGNKKAPVQTRLMSITEACVQQCASFVVGVFIQLALLPALFNIPVTINQAIPIAILFMVAGGLKTYFIRRFFNQYY